MPCIVKHIKFFPPFSLIFICCVFFSFLCLCSCKSLPNLEEDSNIKGSAIPLPKKGADQEQKASSKKKDELLKYIEISSHKSLTKVLNTVLSKPASLDEKDKFYLYLTTNLLEKLYPYDKNKVKVPHFSKKNSYIEGFEALNVNEYPYQMPKNNFLSTIIPVLILATSELPKMFEEDVTSRINLAKNFNPESPLPFYLEGLFCERNYSTLKAKEMYKKAISLDSSFYPAVLKYARLCNDSGEIEESLRVLKLLPKDYEDAEEVLFLNAFANIKKKETVLATPYMEKLLSSDVVEGEGLFERVRLLIERNEYMKANSLLNVYTTKNKTDKIYLLLKARIAREWNKNDKTASQYLIQAYSYYPHHFDVLVACANLSLDSDISIQGKTADDFIQKILEIEKDNVETQKVLLKRELKNENWSSAVDIASKLVKINPSIENKGLLVKAYLGNAQYKDALDISSDLYKTEKVVSNELFFDYLESLYRTGSIKALRQLITDNIETAKGEKLSMLYYYNAIAVAGRSSANYLSLLRSALLTNPRNKVALFSMYEWYFSSKDYRNAQFYLKQAMGIEGGANKKYLELYERLNQLLER